MNKFISTHAIALKLAATGLFAGLLNGFLGAGGGIVVVIAVSRLFHPKSTDKNDAFATALCVMLPVSLLSAYIYARRGNMSLDGFGIFIIPAIIGGAVGGLLLGKLKAELVKRLFALLTAISGILLIVR